MRLALILIGGILFGAGLAISGMTDPTKVIGFLDFLGAWDPALAFVMGGALATFGLGLFILKKTGLRIAHTDLPDTSSEPISKRMLIGSAIFGIGWGLGGFCPGPALANVTTLHPAVMIFLPIMMLGMWAATKKSTP